VSITTFPPTVKPYAFYVNVANVVIANNTTGIINFPTKVVDTHNAVVTADNNWSFTAPLEGVYSITTHVVINTRAYSNVSALCVFAIGPAGNGTRTHSFARPNPDTASTRYEPVSGAIVMPLVKSQAIAVKCYNRTYADIDFYTQVEYSWIGIAYLGPYR
jgi:hypothetical protein